MSIIELISYIYREINNSINDELFAYRQILFAKSYLGKGWYRLNSSKTILSREIEYEKTEGKFILKDQMFETAMISRMLYHFLPHFYYKTDSNSKQGFNGDTLMISRHLREGKIINHSDATILSYFPSAERRNAILANKEKWSSLGYRTLQCIDIDNCYFTEPYIIKQKIDTYGALNYIMGDVLAHQAISKDDLICINLKDNKVNLLSPNIFDAGGVERYISSGYYIKRICHGDLYRNNLLFDGVKFYYTDFELVGEHVFYYDILYYIWFEYYRYDNDSFLRYYFLGKYDSYFEELFNANCCEFDINARAIYLNIALYEYFCEEFHMNIPPKICKYVREICI